MLVMKKTGSADSDSHLVVVVGTMMLKTAMARIVEVVWAYMVYVMMKP